MKLEQIGSNWFTLVKIGSSWIKLDYKIVIIGLNLINLVQIGSSSRSWTKSFLVLFQCKSRILNF